MRPAFLSDSNPRLIAAYLAVRDDVEGLISEPGQYPYEQAHFYAIRDRFNQDTTATTVQIGAWLIYLNRTCVNGLFRENNNGGFNVSFGRYTNPTICNAELLRAASAALRGTDIACADFEERLARLGRGAFAFLDSPYPPASLTANFTGYSKGGAGWKRVLSSDGPGEQGVLFGVAAKRDPTEHERLAACLDRLDARGARFTLTNSDHPDLRRLYARWSIETIEVPRSINSDPEKRGAVNEIVVRNWT